MIFRPPTGGPGVAVAIQPNRSGAVVSDPDGAATVTSAAPVVITGNWAALVIPAALGIGPDWSASAVVRIESATPMPGGSNLTGWVLVTSPVSVGSLTGEVTGSLTIGPPMVLHRSVRGASSATAGLIARPKIAGPTITSTKLDATSGHRLLTIDFDRPPVLPVGDGTITSDTYLITIELDDLFQGWVSAFGWVEGVHDRCCLTRSILEISWTLTWTPSRLHSTHGLMTR